MPGSDSKRARAIGEKLQTARKKQQMSLRELAGKADISASMLSQIETGKAYPSVRTIYSVAAALDVPVDYFFPERDGPPPDAVEAEIPNPSQLTASEMREVNLTQGPEQPPEGESTPVIHAGDRPTIELKGGVTWSRLTALAESEGEFLEVSYEPGASSGAEMSHHEGREFGLILEGRLVIELGFESHTLDRGDSIIFDSTTPHRLINPGPEPMRAVWVVLTRNQKT